MYHNKGTHTMISLKRRLTSLAIAVLALLMLFMANTPTHAATTTVENLPFVNNFATARFKLLTTITLGEQQMVGYGAGAAVMPDRSSLWLASNASDQLVHIVQIGQTMYQRIGDGEWEQSDAGVSDMQFQPLSAQFNQLQQFADAIYDMGPTNVGNTPTEHYQVWLSGTRLLAMNGAATDDLPKETREVLEGLHFKYDFWIGTQDSFLYQQNTQALFAAGTLGADAPAMQMDVLMTFSDINDPNISVNAPN
jgi:hypothetical protein